MSDDAPTLAVLGLRPGPGGVGRVMVNLLAGLVRHGARVDVLLPPGEHPELAAAGLDPLIVPLDAERSEIASVQLRDYLVARRPRAVLSNKDRTNALLAGTTATITRPFTVFRVGTNVLEKLKRGNVLTYPWKRRKLAAVYRSADALIGISPGVSQALEALFGEALHPPVHTIWNPVDLETVRAMAREPAEHPWFTPGHPPVIVSLGRLVAAKDYDTLVRAFRVLRKEVDCRLVIFGEGRQRERLKRLGAALGVGGHFDLPGFTPNPFPFVARANLFVVSSVFEGANNALMEAMALGVPCVSTDCRSGPREILEGGRYGTLVPVRDPVALAGAMRATLRSPPEPSCLRRGAERFDLEINVRAYLKVLSGHLPEDT